MAYDIKLQILQPLPELSINLQVVKVAIQALLYKVFHTTVVITFLVGNCREETVICRLWRLPSKPYFIKSFI